MIDVVVIGAGAGGLAASWALAKRGAKVLCVEQGKDLLSSQMISISRGGEYQKFSDLSSSPSVRQDLFSYPIDCSSSPINIQNYCGVGGSTLLFSAQYPRMHVSDFTQQSSTSNTRSWPISLVDLEPYYKLNERMVGVSGLAGDPNNPRVCLANPPVPLGKMGRKLVQGFQDLGWGWWPAYAALQVKPGTTISDSIFDRPTNIDFKPHKGSARSAYYSKCLKLGVKFMLQASVTEIKFDRFRDKVSGVYIKNLHGIEDFVPARFVVLAAGGIGSPRVLLNSVSTFWPKGIGNSYDLVGTGLMLHPWGYAEGLFGEDLESSRGPQGCCMMSQHFYKYNPNAKICGGFTMQIIRGPLPYESSKLWLKRKKLSLDSTTFSKFKNLHNHTAHISVIVDDPPERSNYVKLDLSTRDNYGVPGVIINYKISDISLLKLCSGLNAAKEILQRSGSLKTWSYGPVRNTGWHTLGTCCMGLKEENSVVDKSGRVHGTENLFVADASVFSRGGSVNPANTIQAIGLMVADRIPL